MSIRLDSIEFDHDGTSATTDALSIRGNATTPSIVPEWRNGVTVTAQDCAVAYAAAPTAGRTLTVAATFTRLDPAIDDVVVRTAGLPAGALALTIVDRLQRFVSTLDRFRNRLIFTIGWPPPPPARQTPAQNPVASQSVLGDVRPTVVHFGNNNVVRQILQLEQPQISYGGIGVFDVLWHWQYRTLRSNWTDFQQTRHRVYVVLDVPHGPWAQPQPPQVPPNSANLPWVDALEFACRWAQGETTTDGAAGRITTSLNGLPPATRLAYDPSRNSRYTVSGTFDCTNFIRRLQGVPGTSQWVDCVDCACMVVTLSNLLGCDLSMARIGRSPLPPVSTEVNGPVAFVLNDVLLIGSTAWQSGLTWGYHDVAWKGLGSTLDEVFDACLLLNGDIDPVPTLQSHTPLQPLKLPFNEYRTRLATRATRQFCALYRIPYRFPLR